MFTHKNIWHAIDTLAENNGFSTSGLAKQAGLDPTSFNKSKRSSNDGKPRWPSTESIAKILSATGTTMQEFLPLIENSPAPKAKHIHCQKLSMIAEDDFGKNGYPVGPKWASFETVGCYEDAVLAIEIDTKQFMPLYKPGYLVLLLPDAACTTESRVIIMHKDGNMAVWDVKTSDQGTTLQHPQKPGDQRVFHSDDVIWCGRILWVRH